MVESRLFCYDTI